MIGGELEQLFIKRVTIFGIIVLLRSLFISCNKIIEIDTPANAVPFLFPYKNKNLYIFFFSLGAVLEDFYDYSYDNSLKTKTKNEKITKYLAIPPHQYFFWENTDYYIVNSKEGDNIKMQLKSETINVSFDFETYLLNNHEFTIIDDNVLLIFGRTNIENQFAAIKYNKTEKGSKIVPLILSNIKTIKCESLGLNKTYCFKMSEKDVFNIYLVSLLETDLDFVEQDLEGNNSVNIINLDVKKGKRKNRKEETIIYCYETQRNDGSKMKITGLCYDILTKNRISYYIINNVVLSETKNRKMSLLFDTSFKLIITQDGNLFEIYDIEESLSYVNERIFKYYEKTNNTLIDSLVVNEKLYLIVNDEQNKYYLKEITSFESKYNEYYQSFSDRMIEEEGLIYFTGDKIFQGNTIFISRKTTGTFSVFYYLPNSNNQRSYSQHIIRILPKQCEIYSDDLLTCKKCKENSEDGKKVYFFEEDSFCYDDSEIPERYYPAKYLRVEPCIEHCLKCTDGLFCDKCESPYKTINNECIDPEVECPRNLIVFKNTCVKLCPNGYFKITINNINQCIEEESLSGQYYDIATIKKNISIFEKSENKNEEIANVFDTIINTELNKDNVVNQLNNILLYNGFVSSSKGDKALKAKEINEMTNSLADMLSDSITVILPFEEVDQVVTSLLVINQTLSNIDEPKIDSIEKLKELQQKLIENIDYILISDNLTESEKKVLGLQVTKASIDINSKLVEYTIKNNSIDENFNKQKFENSLYYKYEKSMMFTNNSQKTMNLIESSSTLSMKMIPNSSFSGEGYEIEVNKIRIQEGFEIQNPALQLLLVTDNTVPPVTITSMSELMNKNNLTSMIVFPYEALNEKYSDQIAYLSIIKYKKYPYLNPNLTTDISNSFVSIKFIDKDYNEIKIHNLTDNIQIINEKKDNNLNQCVFFDTSMNKLNSENCTSTEYNGYIICSCNHLTDFSLASFNPVNIFNDLKRLFNNIRIIDSFDKFKLLTWDNAIILYIYFGLLLIYFIIVIFTIRSDRRSKDDPFIIIIPKDNKCCSKEEVEEEIEEMKTEVNEEIIKRKQVVKKNFFLNGLKNRKMKNAIILKNLGINFNSFIDSENNEQENKKNENAKSSEPEKTNQGSTSIINTFINYEDENYQPPIRKRKNLFQSILEKKRKQNLIKKEEQQGKIDQKEKSEIEMTTIQDTPSSSKSIYSKSHIELDVSTPQEQNKENNSTNNTKDKQAHSSKNNDLKSQRRNAISMPAEGNNIDSPFLYSSYLIFKTLFTKEYRPYTLVCSDDSLVMCKTNIWTLIIIRLITGLSVSSLFSECNSELKDEDLYVNRDLAVAFATIFIIEIPFTIFEVLLCKTRIPMKFDDLRKNTEKFKAIVTSVIIYCIFIILVILGTINTTWISLVADEQDATCNFILDFTLNVLMDYLVYEISVIIIKSLIYTFLIKSSKTSYVKMCLISFIAALPWVFAITG